MANGNITFFFISTSVKKCVAEPQSSIWEQCIMGNHCLSGAAGETKNSISRFLFFFMTHLWGTVGISDVYCSTVRNLANLIWIDHFCLIIYAVSHKCTRYLRSLEIEHFRWVKVPDLKKKQQQNVTYSSKKISTLDFSNQSAYKFTHTHTCCWLF